MFREQYKKDNQMINPDQKLLQETLLLMKKESEKPKSRRLITGIPYRAATIAASVCIVIAAVILLPQLYTSDTILTPEEKITGASSTTIHEPTVNDKAAPDAQHDAEGKPNAAEEDAEGGIPDIDAFSAPMQAAVPDDTPETAANPAAPTEPAEPIQQSVTPTTEISETTQNVETTFNAQPESAPEMEDIAPAAGSSDALLDALPPIARHSDINWDAYTNFSSVTQWPDAETWNNLDAQFIAPSDAAYTAGTGAVPNAGSIIEDEEDCEDDMDGGHTIDIEMPSGGYDDMIQIEEEEIAEEDVPVDEAEFDMPPVQFSPPVTEIRALPAFTTLGEACAVLLPTEHRITEIEFCDGSLIQFTYAADIDTSPVFSMLSANLHSGVAEPTQSGLAYARFTIVSDSGDTIYAKVLDSDRIALSSVLYTGEASFALSAGTAAKLFGYLQSTL